jgi:hypothetical protein
MKNRIKLVLVSVFLISSCQSIGGGLVEPIILPNGAQGFTIDCSAYGWAACFKAAGDQCPSGYAIHERSMEENIKSDIKTEPLTEKENAVVRDPNYVRYSNKDKYMVISCKH